jgi:hypothetical protein
VQILFSLVIPLLGVVSILAAIYFVVRAVSARSRVDKAAYAYGQLETRQSMQFDFGRAVVAFIVGLIFLAVYAVNLVGGGAAPEPAFVPTISPTETAEPEVLETAVPTPTATVTPVPFPTSQVTVVATATSPPIATPTNTPEPAPQTATVSSGVGIYLRAEPSTSATDLAWLQDGTQLIILPGEAQADGYTWAFVRIPDGQEGWVVTEFITINP